LQIAVVLWNGDVGGAERVSAEVIRRWRDHGIDGSIVFVQDSRPLADLLPDLSIPFTALEFARGGGVVRRPRRFAAAVGGAGRDGAVVLDCGYLAALLRLGGYRGPIVGVEHGAALTISAHPPHRRLRHRLERALGARARCVDFAVSDFMLARLRSYPHAAEVRRLYNGADLERFAPRSAVSQVRASCRLVVGSAGRLISGKGFDNLIRAVATFPPTERPLLRIVGEGPDRPRLERIAAAAGLDGEVFEGRNDDMPSFWNACDVAVVPSDTFTESFSMTTLEAMACGRPVVATRNGGIPEVLGETGTLVPAGDVQALADGISHYLADPALRAEAGRRGRARAEQKFDIGRTAETLAACFGSPYKP
jgi:glycosyltransferase involved in cell wall biosynthesis